MGQILSALADRVTPQNTDLLYLRSAAGSNYKIAWSALVAAVPIAVAWGGITGVLNNQTDLSAALALKAPLASPTFTGAPLSTTAAVDTNTTQIATTAFVIGQGYAKLASPTFTGTPASTTAAVDTNTTQIATTAYVIGQGYLKSATAATTYAPLASPALTGTPTSTTAAVDTNTTQIATTAFVIGQGYAKLASPTFTGIPAAPTAAVDTATTQLATTAYVVNQGYAKLASPTFTGTPAAPTAAATTNTTQLATTAFVNAVISYGVYRTILLASASHTAAVVAGTYALANGNAAAVSGTGTLYPLSILRIRSTDYPTINGLAAKFRIAAQIYVNDVAPTGNFTFGLYPVTTPATSGGAGLRIYTLGTVVGSSTVLFTTPAADGQLNGVSADFALPADGDYVIGVITTAAVAASSHLHFNASLSVHNA